MSGNDATQRQYREVVLTFLYDLKFAIRSLSRAKGLAVTVVLTLALGIGANAAIFTLVRGVLLRPLVNRDENRLIYLHQSAPGIGVENAAFSVPEIQDLRGRLKTVSALGEFSTIGFTMVGLGEPREVRAGVVDGSFFEVMGLRPVVGRLLEKGDDGPNAAGACVLTYRFWTTQAKERSVGAWQDDPAGYAFGDHRRCHGARRSVSGRNGDHRQRRNEPSPPFRNDGNGQGTPDDGIVRKTCAGRGSRVGASRASRCLRNDGQGTSRGLHTESKLSDRRAAAA